MKYTRIFDLLFLTIFAISGTIALVKSDIGLLSFYAISFYVFVTLFLVLKYRKQEPSVNWLPDVVVISILLGAYSLFIIPKFLALETNDAFTFPLLVVLLYWLQVPIRIYESKLALKLIKE